ncbi:hypothetical protein IWC96_14410 [Brevundimonas sp. BAL450]|uniref:hypothetical protein n=1 Tax=Brevundimonas sp. BAL450 TaxID=1708162 RepID=UPI0018C9CDEE|nr:hypothetical protein [Brevundimonas sp. BAL450]MBG7616467.1 hypothetical protein [Brevundimonas sp. BAL450]
MPQFEQKSFESGEVGSDHLWRSDLKVRATSARSLKNCRLRVSGIAEGRNGTTRLANIHGDGWVQDMVIDGVVYFAVLTAARLRIFDKATRTQVQEITGCEWTADELPELVIAPFGAEAYVFHQDMQTQVIRRASDGTWSVSDLTFAPGLGNSIRQPYYRFADDGVTLTPSGLTGSITLTASAAYFVAGHVGKRVRLNGREVEITAYTNATTVTGTVRQRLFPTVSIPVSSSDGFLVGEIISGKDSNAQAEVTATGAGTITAILLDFTNFLWDATLSKGETVIGPSGSTTTTGAQTNTTNAATLDWDEQAISDVRGFPGTGTIHKGRLWLGRFAAIPFGVMASALGALDDFQTGVGDEDGIFVELQDEAAGAIQHIVSAEQLLFMTARRLFYYPESEQNPIRPTSFQVIQVGPDGSSLCKPVAISEGVMFAKAGGASILGAFPTGDVRRSWRSVDVSILSAHLIDQPRSMAYLNGQADGPERYVVAVNADGTLAVTYYSDSAEIFGWTPWETEGVVRSVAAADGECWALVEREGVYTLEVFEPSRLMDCAEDVEAADLQGLATDQTILTPSGVSPAEVVYRKTNYANRTVSLTVDDAYLGIVEVDANGDFGCIDTEGAIEIGYNFEAECVPWAPMPAEDERNRRRKVRITRALVRWAGRYMAVNGNLLPPYRADDDITAAPPLRDELSPVPVFGWFDEPVVPFTKPYPAPWRLYGYSLEVTR